MRHVRDVIRLKSAGSRPARLRGGCLYDPQINRSYADMAAHYGTGILPARPRRPRDKAKVEQAVLMVERWLLGRLRQRTFFGLAEVNAAIAELLTRLNEERPIRRLAPARQATVEAAAIRQAAPASLRRRHRLSHPARPRPCPADGAGRRPMDRRSRQPSDLRPLRRRQKLACVCARQQGLPRQSLRALPARPAAVHRSRAGPWRWPPSPHPARARPRRSAHLDDWGLEPLAKFTGSHLSGALTFAAEFVQLFGSCS